MNGDLVIENGDLVMLDGATELAQCCQLVLSTNKGEWFLNPALGIDFSRLRGKGVTAEAIQEQIRSGLRQESRIKTIDSISVSLDTSVRQAKAFFKATADNGLAISDEVITNAG
jgi:hypothetical protein